MQEVNSVIRGLHEAGQLDVLSFCEGTPLSLVPMLPRLVVVPEETGFPGYGETVLLPEADHIDVCKPPSRQDPAYTALLGLISRVSKKEPPSVQTDGPEAEAAQ